MISIVTLVAERVVHPTHTHLITIDTEPLLFVQIELSARRYEQPRRTKYMLPFPYLKGEHVTVQDIVAGIAVKFYTVVHNQFILCSLYPSCGKPIYLMSMR